MFDSIIKVKKKYLKIKSEKEKISSRISDFRLLFFILFIVHLVLFINSKSVLHEALAILWIFSFIILVIVHRIVDDKIDEIKTSLDLIKSYENRRSEEWKKEDYQCLIEGNSFLQDLNIVGKNSLSHYIDFTKSLGGKKALYDELSLKRVSKTRILENQGAIESIKNDFSFVIGLQEKLLKVEDIEKSDFSSLIKCFNRKLSYKTWHLVFSFVLSLITVVLIILSFFGIINFGVPLFFMLLLYSISYVVENKYRDVFEDISSSMLAFEKLKSTFLYLEGVEFKDKKCVKLLNNIKDGHDVLIRLTKIAEINMFRTNFILNFIMNGIFSLNIVIVYLYSKLLEEETEKFKRSIKALEEFEVLISLATIPLVRDSVCVPSITDEMELDVEEIRHPLLLESSCIPNDFKCLKDLNIITGSNMSGKTSFMRTIGVNLVLAYTGSCVCAKNFKTPIMKIFTSINVKDDIANGISTFYEELRRVKEVLDYSSSSDDKLVVFIDEIFKGTNYNDRILGAKEVLRKLKDVNCMVFLTTHDFELCEVKSKKICNYHFSESYKDDKIHFDYKIKEGQCKTTNAKYLMKKMGIIKTRKQ